MLAADDGDKLSIAAMTEHFFASGVYARQMTIPAGALVVGKLHKTEHLSVLLSGSVQITTESGTQKHHAPKVMVAPPGTKRVALALTDCIWLTFHAVGEERDLEKIEERFIAKSFDELEAIPQSEPAQVLEAA